MASTEITVVETQRRKGSIKESWICNCREKEEASEQQLKLYLMLSPNQQQFISAYTGQPLDHRLYIQNPLLPCTMNLRKKHMKIRNILGTFIGKTDFIFPSKHLKNMNSIQISLEAHSSLLLLYFLLAIKLLADAQQTVHPDYLSILSGTLQITLK